MGIRRCNGEGYHDPTTYEALSNIRKEEKAAKHAYRPLVYICSPFAGDTEGNTEKARHYCRFAVRSACIPLAPHLLFPQFMDDTVAAERSLAMFMNRCGYLEVLYPQAWQQRLRKRKRGICRSAISQKIVRRLDYLENDILHGKLQGQCKEQHLSQQACC